MADQTKKDGFAAKAQALYRRRGEELPPDVVRRLATARRAALAHAERRPRSLLWAPAGAVAAGLLAVAVFQIRDPGGTEGGPAMSGVVVEDMELLFDETDLDLLEELDFYAWIGTDVDAG